MEDKTKTVSEITQAADDLFNFAIDREDVKWLLGQLPRTAETKHTTVEYELQILKIISVGWSIAYYLEEWPEKNKLSEQYWLAVYGFSQNLSETTALMIGQDINYFDTLKTRLDQYVAALNAATGAKTPETVIGPEFAKACGNPEDIFASLTGTKMFVSTIGNVKTYLETLQSMDGSEGGHC